MNARSAVEHPNLMRYFAHYSTALVLMESHLITSDFSLVHGGLQIQVTSKAGKHLCQNNTCSHAPWSSLGLVTNKPCCTKRAYWGVWSSSDALAHQVSNAPL